MKDFIINVIVFKEYIGLCIAGLCILVMVLALIWIAGYCIVTKVKDKIKNKFQIRRKGDSHYEGQ